jgi:hypothetical protein
MDYRPLGNTGLRVSAVGFGAWQLNNPIWGGPDEAGSIELVQAALDAGCNFYDTAPGYGGGIDKLTRGRGPTPLTPARIAPQLDDNAHCNSGLSCPWHRMPAIQSEDS